MLDIFIIIIVCLGDGGGKYGWIMSPQVSTTRWTGRTGHLSNPNAAWYFSYFIQQNFSIFFFCWASKWEIIQNIKIKKKNLCSPPRGERAPLAPIAKQRRPHCGGGSGHQQIDHYDDYHDHDQRWRCQYFTFFSLQKPEWRASLQCLRPLLQTS